MRDHAEVFGGDPDRVMIYGQFGGAGKVVTVMGMPSAKGLFHAAAVQSGGGRGGDKSSATESALELLAALGLGKDNARDIQDVPLERLMAIGAGAAERSTLDLPVAEAHPFLDRRPERDQLGVLRCRPAPCLLVLRGSLRPPMDPSSTTCAGHRRRSRDRSA